MSVSVVRLGTPRLPHEGVRIGTVRRPPRGVPKTRYAADDWFDVWLPLLAPSPATVKLALIADSAAQWRSFEQRYRREMARPAPGRVLDLLAALSHTADFSVGCYCADEARCHRRILRALLAERGAKLRAAGSGTVRGAKESARSRASSTRKRSVARAGARRITWS